MSGSRVGLSRCVLAIGLMAQAGCSVLSAPGPSAGSMVESEAVQVVNITPADAKALRDEVNASDKADVDRTLAALQSAPTSSSFRFGPGVTMNIALWSVSPWVEASATSSPSTAPGSVPLGTYTVSTDGVIILPYAGKVSILGLTLQQAQDIITQRFTTLGIVQKPSVTIDVKSVPQGRIIVTGSIGQPKILPWSPAGVTLAEAITESFGDGAASLGQSTDLAMNGAAVRVVILRTGAVLAELPMSVALEREIPLRPGDRIVVKKAPAVKVTVLGGGINKNGVYGFAEPPSLSEVLAKASGLDGNVADSHAVFILRLRDGGIPILYDFAWNHIQGLIASQEFEMLNGDLVYVAEAPIVPVQRVISTLFQLALPAQALK